MEGSRRALVEFWERIKEIVRPMVERLAELCRQLMPLVRAIRTAHARAKWQEAQQTARFLSRHPDVAEFDGWLDRWYPDPALV